MWSQVSNGLASGFPQRSAIDPTVTGSESRSRPRLRASLQQAPQPCPVEALLICDAGRFIYLARQIGERSMPFWTCEQCGAQFPESAAPPSSCPICEDERQFVN